jgi:excisionase family DNA binding protein
MSRHEQARATTAASGGNTTATMSVEEAAELLGIGRTLAYRLATRNELPTPVVRIGRTLRVPTAPLLELLGLPGSAERSAAHGDVAGASDESNRA